MPHNSAVTALLLPVAAVLALPHASRHALPEHGELASPHTARIVSLEDGNSILRQASSTVKPRNDRQGKSLSDGRAKTLLAMSIVQSS